MIRLKEDITAYQCIKEYIKLLERYEKKVIKNHAVDVDYFLTEFLDITDQARNILGVKNDDL